MNSKLKQCPFCGSNPVRMSFLDSDIGNMFYGKSTFYFGCRNCNTVISITANTEGEAINRWNRGEAR